MRQVLDLAISKMNSASLKKFTVQKKSMKKINKWERKTTSLLKVVLKW